MASYVVNSLIIAGIIIYNLTVLGWMRIFFGVAICGESGGNFMYYLKSEVMIVILNL